MSGHEFDHEWCQFQCQLMICARQRPRGVINHDASNDGDSLSPLSSPLLGFCTQVLWVFLFFARPPRRAFFKNTQELDSQLRSDSELIASLLPVQPVHHVQKYHQIAIQVGVKGAFWELGGGGSAQASGIAARKNELFNNIQSHNASQISIPA